MKGSKKITFTGIGAPKSGSSWVSDSLYEHPQVQMPGREPKKELDFFCSRKKDIFQQLNHSTYGEGFNWYLKQFPAQQQYKGKNKIIGEFSVSYLSDAKSPELIKKHLPDVKLIAVLRNPTDMIFSLHNYILTAVKPKVPKNFAQAIKKGHYIKDAKYGEQLINFYKYFKKQQIHIIFFEDIINKPEKVLKNLFNFLHIDNTFKPSFFGKKVNPAVETRSEGVKKLTGKVIKTLENLKLKPVLNFLQTNETVFKLYRKINTKPAQKKQIPPKLRKKLISYFKEDISLLENLTGRDLSNWKR